MAHPDRRGRSRPLLAAALVWLAVVFSGLGAHAQGIGSTAAGAPDALSQYVLNTWSVEDGLPQSSVVSIVQTRDGYLWLGTQEGLVRFDGLSFTTYTREVPNPHVSALHEDADGTLWIGTYGGLALYTEGRFTPRIAAELPGDHVSALASTPDGALWIGTFDGGLARLHDGDLRTFSTPDGMPEGGVAALTIAPDGTLWIGMTETGLVRYRDGRFTHFTTADGLPSDEVTSLHAEPDGSVWVGTQHGLARIVAGRILAPPSAEAFSENNVQAVYRDDQGTLWLGTLKAGLARFRPTAAKATDQVERMTAAEGLPHRTVHALYEDREGSLWVGTDGGLARLRSGRFTPYSTPEGLPNPIVLSVYEDAEGVVWMGTEGGGLARLEDGRITSLTIADGLPTDAIFAVRGTEDGSLWLGTNGEGLVRLKDGRITTFTTADGLPDMAVFALYEDRAGTLWLGTSGGLVRYRDGRFSTLTTADGLSNNLITVITEDASGRLWVGTYEGGLNVLDGGSITHISTEDGLPSNLILSLHTRADGTVWVGTQEGLSRIIERPGGSFAVRPFGAGDGMPSETILQIFEDAEGWLWMSTNQGLIRARADDFAAVADGRKPLVNPFSYGRADGLRSEEFNGGVQPAGWQGRDGTLWFPSTDGVVAVDPAHVLEYPAAVAQIHAMTADGDALPLSDNVRLAPEQRRLTLSYTAPSFLSPERITYRYRLEGEDETWTEAGTRREAFYTNLAPGDYTFHVQAVNADGVPGPIRSLSFRLTPYFYEATWFVLLCVLVAAIIPVVIYAARVHFLKTQRHELETLVEARTEDLSRANQRLAETSEIKSQLMHVVAHDLKNPLNGVHGLARTLREELHATPEHEELALLIEEAAEQMLTMVIRFLDAEALEATGEVPLSIKPVDVAGLAQESLGRFESQAERKEQRLSFEAASTAPYLADADPMWLKEAFNNLISNAVKYTPPGGHIHVSVDHPEPDGPRQIRFAVRDEGPGLTEDDMAKLFGRFQRLSAQPTGGESSTGLGLSIVKSIVERHGGRVWVESAPGEGSTFFIELESGSLSDEASESVPPQAMDQPPQDVDQPPAVTGGDTDDVPFEDPPSFEDPFATGIMVRSDFYEGSAPSPEDPAQPRSDVEQAAFVYLD